MSSATPDGVRPVSFLPSIKCSNCGDEIEIAAMGDHICGGEMPQPIAIKSHTPNLSNPFTLRQLNASGQQWPSVTPSPPQQSSRAPAVPQSRPAMPMPKPSSNESGAFKASRIALPKINPDIANRPCLAPLPTGLDSPVSPGTRARNGKSGVQRSMTSPMPRLFDPRPPSPELSANLDCAFPPWPSLNVSPRPPASQERRTPTGSERAPSRSAPRFEQDLTSEPEPFNLEPRSPYANGSESVLQKLNTLKSGPFASNRRQGTADSNGPAPLENCGISETNQTVKQTPPARPARPHGDILSPSFLEQFSAELLPLGLPKDENDAALSETHSGPELRRSSNAIPTSQMPVRRDSRAGMRVDHSTQDAPPVPTPTLRYQQAGNHTPTGSASSVTSTTHSTNDTKSTHSSDGPSPIGSSMSSVDAFNSLKPGERAELRKESSPPRSLTHPVVPREIPQKPTEIPLAQPLEPPVDPAPQAQAGPMTPWATLGPRNKELPRRSEPDSDNESAVAPQSEAPAALSASQQSDVGAAPRTKPLAPRSISPATRAGPNFTAPSAVRANSRAQCPDVPRPPAVPRDASRPRTPGRRPTNAKSMCRGCGQLIEGKSVKAADGRLTGRWHKACFVCKTCTKPFATADFYVINNEPYCEHDYHEQNGSLCHGCHRGIEGQYLETTSSTRFGSADRKFHPRCFTCWECRSVLSEDYFEINGRVFCERHALAAMRAQARRAGTAALHAPGRRDLVAERRTTRLINPIMA